MTIAFYKVDNSLNYGRHEFDNDTQETIIEKLNKLPDDEVKVYDAGHYGWSSKELTLADFVQTYNDEELDGGWWCVVASLYEHSIQEPKEEKETLESMVSEQAYDEIVSKVKEQVGEESFNYIFPAIKKALEEGGGAVREEILRNWLDCESMRVCSYCGEIMQEGWYLEFGGYACSDECAAEGKGITMEEFRKYRIYKDDILEYLKEEGEGRKIEDLTQDEIEEIIDDVSEDAQYCYTDWY